MIQPGVLSDVRALKSLAIYLLKEAIITSLACISFSSTSANPGMKSVMFCLSLTIERNVWCQGKVLVCVAGAPATCRQPSKFHVLCS